MTEINIPLLRKAVEWVEAEAAKPASLREWNQAFYVVPRTADDPRVADGSAPAWNDWVKEARADLDEACGTQYCVAGFVAEQGDEPWTYNTAADVARKALGLDRIQASRLFWGMNTAPQVRALAESFAGEKL